MPELHPPMVDAGNNDGTVPSAILSEVQSGEGITIVEVWYGSQITHHNTAPITIVGVVKSHIAEAATKQ